MDRLEYEKILEMKRKSDELPEQDLKTKYRKAYENLKKQLTMATGEYVSNLSLEGLSVKSENIPYLRAKWAHICRSSEYKDLILSSVSAAMTGDIDSVDRVIQELRKILVELLGGQDDVNTRE